MKISILHATRRPNEALNAINNWLFNASMKYPIEYILSIDSDDKACYDYSEYLEYPDFKIIRNHNRSAVDAFNNAAKVATGDLFVCISDDFISFLNWDLALLAGIHWDPVNLFLQIDRKTDYIVKTQDGIQPTLITLPIMDRTYYNRFGYIYHPDYQHMFCDQEMTAVGHMLGKVITLDLTFEHLHYTTGKSPKDAINCKNDNTWVQGEALFNDRLSFNFGIENPVIPYPEIKWR